MKTSLSSAARAVAALLLLAAAGCAPADGEQPVKSAFFDQPVATFYAQNMALMVFPGPYKGTDRGAAIRGLITLVREQRPTVVGLSEVFAEDEQAEIRGEMRALGYAHELDGPNEFQDLESDGGLMLFSQHPFSVTNKTVYRACYGEDCLANKGILHGRVVLPSGSEVDVFLTHLQNPTPKVGAVPSSGPGGSAPDKVMYQVSVLSDWLKAVRDVRFPALVMGDINVNGNDPALYEDMMHRLGWPADLGGGLGNWGMTWDDDASSFEPDRPILPVWAPERFQRGKRLDYFFSYPGTLVTPHYTDTWVVIAQDENGRDISDHYGLWTVLGATEFKDPPVDSGIKRLTVKLNRFHCLYPTSGPVPILSREVGDDEVEFKLKLSSPSRSMSTSTSRLFEDVSTGTRKFIPDRTLSWQNPTELITVNVRGWEVDNTLFGIRTDTSHIGNVDIFLTPTELLHIKRTGGFTERAVRLKGLGGEYVVGLDITVE